MSAAALAVLAVTAAACAGALRWPLVGLLAYLWLDFMRPHDLYVELRDYRPMLVLGAVTVAATAWHQRRRVLDAWWSLAPLIALVALVALSTATSVDPYASSAALVQIVKMLIVVWVIDALVTSEQRVRAVFWVIGLSLAVPAAAAIVQAFDRGLLSEAYDGARWVGGFPGLRDGVFRDNNDLARGLALALPLWWALTARAAPTWLRAVAAAGFALTVSAIVATYSRSGFLAMTAAVVVVSLSYRPWWRGVGALLAFAAALLVFAPRPYLDRIATIARPLADRSFSQRVAVWREGVQIGRERLLQGQGPGTFRRGAADAQPVRRSAHNVFIEVFAELGFAGLAAYVAVLIAALLRLHRTRRAAGRSAWSYTASFAVEAALLAYLTASMALSAPFAAPLFVLIGLALALQRSSQRDFPEGA